MRLGLVILAPAGGATQLPDWTAWVYVVNVSYALGAIVVALTRSDSASTVTDRRRARVLMVGTIVGAAAGAGAVARYWWDPWGDIFATRIFTVLSLVVLAMPASFAYAILRHRLFDVSLIVRQGLRYALARRFVDAMIPTLAGVLLFDILVNRDQPLADLVRSRWWWFTLVGAALWLVRTRREAWLRSVDRRFFRERYDAHRLLSSIADQISHASSFDAIAPSVTQQIDEALHPQFVDVLRYVPGDLTFAAVAAGLRGNTVGPCRRRWRSLACCRCCASRSRSRSATPHGCGTSSPARSACCLSSAASSCSSRSPRRKPAPCRSRCWCSGRGGPKSPTTRKTSICSSPSPGRSGS